MFPLNKLSSVVEAVREGAGLHTERAAAAEAFAISGEFQLKSCHLPGKHGAHKGATEDDTPRRLSSGPTATDAGAKSRWGPISQTDRYADDGLLPISSSESPATVRVERQQCARQTRRRGA